MVKIKTCSPKTPEEANSYVGRKVKMKVSSTQHGISTGDICTITKIGWGSPCYYYMDSANKYFTWSNFTLVTMDEKFLKEYIVTLTDQKRILNDEIVSIKRKLEYLKETGQTEFDETEYKSFSIIRAVRGDKKLNDLELAKLVAQIVND